MKLSYLNKEFVIDQDIMVLQNFIDEMNEQFLNQNLAIRSIIVNGIEINNDFEKYVLDNINNIEYIEVKGIKIYELLKEVLIDASKYLERAIPEIEKLHEEFYTNVTSSTWDKFNLFLEGAQWIVQVIQSLNNQALTIEFQEIQHKLNSIMEEMLGAIENQDTTLIGDLLSYEIATLYEEILSGLQNKEEGSVE